MSILIKNRKMPETCDECQFHHYHSAGKYVCEATPMFYPWNLANTKGIRKEWCPLVPVPEHGPLIDAGEFEVVSYEGIPDGYKDTFDDGVLWMCEKIDNAPTIIPAEDKDGAE